MPERKKGGAQEAGWRFVGAISSPTGTAPEPGLPEFAFAGRSNVGKSTLINRLTKTPGLARTSSTPGRTQQINFFLLPEKVVFADLPGYGFAKVPERIRSAWKPLLEHYLRSRDALRAVVIIVDARRGLGGEDELLREFVTGCGRPAIVVANKIDKLRQAERARLQRELASRVPDFIAFSATSGEGERELWKRLTALAVVR
ncbi:MAG: YihA family ribosome biogenesis GTP-binding protein [Deltaproteobacteria bacterium]|nr:YihA family ribosome biogenesis GTP-binding protein [Deltaproteobacteria bacterium]